MMMMTADSFLNVDSHYDSLYEKLGHYNGTHPKLPSREKDLNQDMAFRLVSTRKQQISPSLLYARRSFEDSEDMDIERNILSPEEMKALSLNRNVVDKNFLSIHGSSHSNMDFPFDSLQRPSLHFGRGPSDLSEGQSSDFTSSPNLSSLSRLSSDDRRLIGAPGGFDDDDDDSWKVCGVCNDKATGYHFNALTCEGCKGFFRRSIKNGKAFTCSYNNQCNITKNNRRQCQACRLRKCIEIGMKRECIMSPDQIQQKKTLILSNRIKRAAQYWTPLELTEEQDLLLETICVAFKESNNPPDANQIRGGDVVVNDAAIASSPCPASPASTSSSTSRYVDLIKGLSNDIVSRTPSNMANFGGGGASEAHVMHFTDIMEYTIKEVIKFCKKIPTFMDLTLPDQIVLLKAGCTEIMFLKANYTYDIKKKALTLGPDILYTRDSFLQGGMSESYADAYLKFHEDLGVLKLDDKEMASLSAITLFSADRSDISEPDKIEAQQQVIALALNAYTDSEYRQRNRFAHILSFLPRLRTLNALCTQAFSQVEKEFGSSIKPLVKEVQPDEDDDSDT